MARLDREEKRRSLCFRTSYWARVEELVPHLTKESQSRILVTAKQSLDRAAMRRLEQAIETGVGILSLEEAHQIASRYGLLSTRRQFDWGRIPSDASVGTRILDGQLTSGIWAMDVELRREVEALLKTRRLDPPPAAQLRNQIEGTAGQLAASLDAAREWPQQVIYWSEIAGPYDAICNDLDAWLTLAGAPASYEQG